MTADWFDFPPRVLRRISNHIIKKVGGINRVAYDVAPNRPQRLNGSDRRRTAIVE